MARSDKVSVIDGFTSVQVAKRSSGSADKKPRLRPSVDRLPAREKREAAGQDTKGMRIGHTIEPERYDIACYECGYVFVITGKLQDTICPKCRNYLAATNHVIDKEFNRAIKTIGTVETRPEASLNSNAGLTGGTVILACDAREATIKAFRQLELRAGAKFDSARMEIRDLAVSSGADIYARKKIVCRNLTVAGTFNANITVNGTACVRAGGSLKGKLNTPRLVTEDGAYLNVSLTIKPEHKNGR